MVEDTGMALVAATERWSISKRTRVDLAMVSRENHPKKWREKLGNMTSLYHFPIWLPTKLRILHDFTKLNGTSNVSFISGSIQFSYMVAFQQKLEDEPTGSVYGGLNKQ